MFIRSFYRIGFIFPRSLLLLVLTLSFGYSANDSAKKTGRKSPSAVASPRENSFIPPLLTQGNDSRDWILSNTHTTDVLIPSADRNRFGPFSFSRASVDSAFCDVYDRNLLFDERSQRLRAYFEIDDDFAFLDDAEKTYRDNMIEAAETIVLCGHSPITLKEKPYVAALQQFARAVSSYLEHRPKGIRSHLASGNVDILYHDLGREPFPNYKNRQEEALRLFERQPSIIIIRKKLARLAPTLDVWTESAEKFLVEPRNSYDSPFLETFKAPPSLDALKIAVSFVSDLSAGKIDDGFMSERIEDFKKSIQSLIRARDFESIYKYLEIHGTLENLLQASLDSNFWSSYQTQFWKELPVRLLYLIGKSIPYSHADINDDQAAEKWKKLKNPQISPEKSNETRRYIHHFYVQWSKLKKLGLLVFHAKKLGRPFHENILLASVGELIPELNRSIMPHMESWLNFEMALAMNRVPELAPIDEIPAPKTPALTFLSDYAADVAYLTKLCEVLEDLSTIDTLPAASILRVFTIFGEVAKNLSDYSKSQLNADLFKQLAGLRDHLHHVQKDTRKMHRILDESADLRSAILADFKKLSIQVKNFIVSMPTTWDELKVRYQVPFSLLGAVPASSGICALLDKFGDIPEEDFELLLSTRQSRVTDLEVHRNFVQDTIADHEVAMKSDRNDFESHLEALAPLTKTEKKDILEFYKKLREGGRRSYLLKEASRYINSQIEESVSEETLLLLQNFQALLGGDQEQYNKGEDFWNQIIKSQFLGQKKMTTGLGVIYHSELVDIKENEDRKKYEKSLFGDSFNPKPDDVWDDEVKNLIRKLKSFTTPKKDDADEETDEKEMIVEKNLSSELDRLGITDKAPWEQIRRKIQYRPRQNDKKESVQSDKKTSQEQIENILESSMTAVSGLLENLGALDRLTYDKNGDLGRVSLKEFWDHPAMHLSAAHHIEMIRQYSDVIQDAIHYLVRYDIHSPYASALNDFYYILSLKLKKVRLTGNYFAHLHDVAEFASETSYGVRWALFEHAMLHVDGFPYGGQNGRSVRYLPSLKAELEKYANILGSIYERGKDLASSSASAVSS